MISTEDLTSKKTRKKTGIVICNYNKSSYVVNCIQSVLESDTTDYDIYMVDNASSDDSVSAVKKCFGDAVTILENPANLGGSGGFNTGLRMVLERGYPYIWCLDNDVLVDESALSALLQFLIAHPEVGMAGSKVYHMDHPDYVQQFGLTVDYEHFCTVANYVNCLEDGSMPDYLYCDAVAACSVLLRLETLLSIGLMPEENFLYWDDTEWGMRCHATGLKVASVGASKVLHAMGAKKEVVNTFAAYYSWRNRIFFFLKYTPVDQLERFCNTMLLAAFEEVYGGYYRQESAMATTVLYALDDALHGCMRKADDEKILDVDYNLDKLETLLTNRTQVQLLTNGYDALAQQVSDRILALRPDITMICDERIALTALTIELCDYIFTEQDFKTDRIYIDTDFNIFTQEDRDFDKVFSYRQAQQVFLFSRKPLFLSCAREYQKRRDTL